MQSDPQISSEILWAREALMAALKRALEAVSPDEQLELTSWWVERGLISVAMIAGTTSAAELAYRLGDTLVARGDV